MPLSDLSGKFDKDQYRETLNRMLNRKYAPEMTPEERIKGGASALPVVGDAISLYDGVQAIRNGDYVGGGLGLLGALPLIPGLAGYTKYARRTQSPDDLFNGNIYAMFARADNGIGSKLDDLAQYGPGKWAASDNNAVDIKDLQKDLMREIRRKGLHNEYGTTAASLVREANPSDIVNSAGFWDNPALVSEVYERVIGGKGISKIKTNDGLIVFDRKGVKKIGK